jgi:hypothetical protein
VDDHLAVAHVVFFDLRPLAHAPQLHERVARVALVLGRDDLRGPRREQPSSTSFGSATK